MLGRRKGTREKSQKISESPLDGQVSLGHPAGVSAKLPFSVRFPFTQRASPDHTYPMKSIVSSSFFLDQTLSPRPFQAVWVRLRNLLLFRWFNSWLCDPLPHSFETRTLTKSYAFTRNTRQWVCFWRRNTRGLFENKDMSRQRPLSCPLSVPPQRRPQSNPLPNCNENEFWD